MLKSTNLKAYYAALIYMCVRVRLDVSQDMQTGLDRESSSLMDLESQKRLAHERLEEMDQQHSKLDGMLSDMKQKCQEESHKVREYILIRATCTLTHTHIVWLHRLLLKSYCVSPIMLTENYHGEHNAVPSFTKSYWFNKVLIIFFAII